MKENSLCRHKGLNHIHLTVSHGYVSQGLREEKLVSHSMEMIPKVFINELFGNIAQTPLECFPQFFPLVYSLKVQQKQVGRNLTEDFGNDT